MTGSTDKKINFSPHERAKFNLEIIQFLRPFLEHKKLIFKSINIKNLLDSIELLYNNVLKESDQDKVIEWIQIAEDDLHASQRLHGAENNLSLFHLQQCVEKLLKSTLIYWGFKTEEEVVRYNHQPQKFLVEIIENNTIKEVLGDKYPFLHVKKPEKYDEKKLKQLKHLLSDKQKLIDEGGDFIKHICNLPATIDPAKMSASNFENRMKDVYKKKISTKESTRLNKRLQERGIDLDEIFSVIATNQWLLMTFTLVLLPLSISTWVFESITRYPDQRRLLKKDFTELEIYKNYNTIVHTLEDYIEIFKTMI